MKPLLADVTVNGVTIPAARIAAEAQNHPAPPGKPGLAWKAAARALATRELLLQEARRLRLEPDPAEIAPGQFETEEEALIRQALDAALHPEQVSDDALRTIYEASSDQFRAPTLYEASHILYAADPDDSAALAAAKARATAAASRLAASPRDFDRLAREESACSSRDAGGRLGQLTASDVVAEFAAALDLLDVNAISPSPVLTRFGFHIVRLDAREKGAVLPFERVAPRLREAAEKLAWARAAQTLVRELFARAEVVGLGQEPDRPQ